MLRFSFLLFVFSLSLLLGGCASQKVSGVPLNSDLSHISEVCVVQGEKKFSDVLSSYLADRRIPHRVVPAAGTSKENCEFRLESSYKSGWDIVEYVAAYRLQAIEDKEVVAEAVVTQPDNADFQKYSSDDLVVKAAEAIGLGMTKIGSIDIEVYNIDMTRVTTKTLQDANSCTTGGSHKVIIEGVIGPDSSFAIERVLERLEPCRRSDGQVLAPVTVSLQSNGGRLNDGYAMGEIFRIMGVTTVIEAGHTCASSCAVAFLGGVKRIVEDKGSILFHAPYYTGLNEYGKRDIDCDIPEPELQKLNDYYVEMAGREAGDRLYERTIWYCSAEDGWVVSGGSAAELFDIATEK